ncbi:unnamed protein product [Lota lota]
MTTAAGDQTAKTMGLEHQLHKPTTAAANPLFHDNHASTWFDSRLPPPHQPATAGEPSPDCGQSCIFLSKPKGSSQSRVQQQRPVFARVPSETRREAARHDGPHGARNGPETHNAKRFNGKRRGPQPPCFRSPKKGPTFSSPHTRALLCRPADRGESFTNNGGAPR